MIDILLICWLAGLLPAAMIFTHLAKADDEDVGDDPLNARWVDTVPTIAAFTVFWPVVFAAILLVMLNDNFRR